MIRAANYEPQLTFEIVTDPAEIAGSRAQAERHRLNSDWLYSHWGDLLPQARGKFVAVAGQEGHIAESAEEAWAWAKRTHPSDSGAFVQYVHKQPGPRIYANYW